MRSSPILSLLLLLASMLASATPGEWSSRWQSCHAEVSPQLRLACYDALVGHATSVAGRGRLYDAVPGAAVSKGRSPSWLAIEQQELGRMDDSPAFLLRSDTEQQTLTITRPASGAILAVSCSHSISQLRLRLDAPWQGDLVLSRLDGALSPAAPDANWFIRDDGYLLEYGRGLPAIDELRRWFGHDELRLQNGQGRELRLQLDGLSSALQPLRQLCHW